MKILGIDPGSSITGWAFIDETGLEYGVLSFGKEKMSQSKIKKISRRIKDFLTAMKPEVIFIERTFSKSIYSTQALTIVRALFFLWAKCPVYELTTSEWRKLAGAGKDKQAVKEWAVKNLDLSKTLPLDIYEAVGIATAGIKKIERR